MVDNHFIGFHPTRLAILRPAPLRKRLWQGGVALAMVLSTFIAGNFFIEQDKSVGSRTLGHDFLAFYSAGTFARTGQFNRLYDLSSIRDTEHSVAMRNNLEIGPSFGPYWNPPFYAWLFAPLSAMPYRWALAAWTGFNIICLVIGIGMLMRMMPQNVSDGPRLADYYTDDASGDGFHRDWRNSALVPLLVLVSMPFIQAISHGQNTFTSLLLLTLVVTAWRQRSAVLAGVWCGLLFYKPQLAAVIAGMLVLTLGLRVIYGLGAVGLVLTLITLFTMPGVLEDYLVKLPAILNYMQVEHAYLWERHVTLKAFWRLLFQGRDAGAALPVVQILWLTSCGTIVLGLIGAWWRTRTIGNDDCWTGETRGVAHDRLLTATICSMPLLMPFYFDYDLLLLSVPAVLFASEMISRAPNAPFDRVQRMMIGTWIALFAWLYVNPPLAGSSMVNVTVILLGTLSALSITRALRRGIRTESLVLPTFQHVVVRRAA